MGTGSTELHSTFLGQPQFLHDPLQVYSTPSAYSTSVLSFATAMFHGPGANPSSAGTAPGSRRAEPPVVSNVSNTVPRQPQQPRHPYYNVESEPQFAPQADGMPHHDEADDTSPFAYHPPSTAQGAPPSIHHAGAQLPAHGGYQAYQYSYAQPQQQGVMHRPPPEAPPSSSGSQHASGPFQYAPPPPNYNSPTYNQHRQPAAQYPPPQAAYSASAYHAQQAGHSPAQAAHQNVGLGLPVFHSAAGMPFPPQAQVQFPHYAPPPGQPNNQSSSRLFTVGATASYTAPYETRLFPDMGAPGQQQQQQQHGDGGSYAPAGYDVQYQGQESDPFVFGAGPYGDPQAGSSNPARGRRLTRDVGYEEDNKYHCPHCSFITERSHDLRRHMKKHGKARTRPCSRCGKDFARSDALTRHQKGTKNCPRPKVTGEDGKEGDKSEKDEPPLDDDEEEEEEGHGGEGDSRQGGSSSNQGTSQRPNSGWSSYGGMSDY